MKLLEKILQDLNVEQSLINQIIIRYSTSNLIKAFIEELKKLKENDNPINLILHFFLLAAKMKPISCDKKTLSKLTGLTERMIDEKEKEFANQPDIIGMNDFYDFVLINFPTQTKRMMEYGRRNVSWSTVNGSFIW